MSCDIVIPIWNQPELTKATVGSIIKNTGFPYRLILVDNASSGETRRYLEDASKNSKNIFLIRNNENLGFIKAVNKGISESNSEYICVMNNDTLAAEGWLNEIIEVLKSNPVIGIVNPASNNFGIFPAKNETLDEFAEKLKTNAGKWIELNSCIGFCMVFKRELINKIGLFDEIYGMGNFEDTDYSRKAQKLGLKCVMAKASYVWHAQNSSFRLLKRFDKSFKENRKVFESRWGMPKRVLYIKAHSDGSQTQNLPEESIEFLKKGDWVTIFKLKEIVFGKEAPNYAGLKIYSFSGYGLLFKSFFKIIFKKKKYNAIYVDDLKFKNFLSFFKPVHRGEVFYKKPTK